MSAEMYQGDFFSAYGGDATAFVIEKPVRPRKPSIRAPRATKDEPAAARQETHKRPTQAGRILAWLLAGNRITAIVALERFGCFRLAARVHELRAEGHRIESRTVETQGGKKVEEYWMEVCR